MFKKSNRNFRSKKNDSDDDGESKSNEVIVTKQITHATSVKPTAVSIEDEPTKAPKSTILSFDLGEEEGTFNIQIYSKLQ